MIKKYTIYGERCSGTNYLENLIDINFNAEITWKYGWKHFFGFNDDKLKDSDDTLFICIVRDIKPWLNSLYRDKHHLPEHLKNKIDNFLNEEFYSISYANFDSDGHPLEIMQDRNIYTGERYKNIFELRHTKLKYMIDDLPNKVKNYVFIRYEDLINNFATTMEIIKEKGLQVKENIIFPVNTDIYRKCKNIKMHNGDKPKNIPDNIILNNKNLIKYYEKKLNYI